MKIQTLMLSALILGAGITNLNAQQAPTAADTALAACAAAAESKNEANANTEADKANQLFDVALASGQRVADALTGKARVISQCRIPFAPMMRKGALIEDSNDLLKRALAADSMHFGARFVLGSNYYFMPEFLGQTDNAIREFEKLIELFGSKPIPLLATVRDRLSELYKRKGATGPTSKAAVYDVAPIVVEAGRFSVDDARGSASLKRMDIVTMPGGTADVLQVFQAMPGVTRATEGSDLYVRGGDPAEAPVFVDGARMTYAGSFEGLSGGIFGVLDPNGIKKADFSSGGFSAKFGNALSGILDITSEGRAESGSWGVGANLVSGSARFRTPLGDKGGVYFTGKATETSALLWTQGRGDEFPSKPWSVNGMGGATYNATKNIELKATALTETDDAVRTVDVVGYRGPLHASGGTHMALLSARMLNSEGNRSLRSTVSAGRRITKFELGVLDRDRHDDMLTLRVDGDVTTANAIRVRGGFEAASMQAIEAGAVPTSDRLAPGSSFRAIDARTEASHVGAYVETEMNVGSHVAFIAGTRADKLPVADSWTIDPRFAIAYRGNGWTLRTGGGLFHQSSWRTGYTTPTPNAPSGVATRAKHVVVGLEREAPVFLRVEAFMKSYDGYTEATGSAVPALIQQGPAIDKGRAIGVDALIRWKASGALSGWASYSYLDGEIKLASSQVPKLASSWIPSAVDVHHTFTGVAKLAVGDNWEIGTTARLATGKPYTPYNQAVHSDRLPSYPRLDTRLTRLIQTKGGMVVAYIEGLNLLDRHNVMGYTYDSSFSRRIPVESFFAHRTLVIGAEAMF